jgi:ABC-2 type transport system ATP-binding protein
MIIETKNLVKCYGSTEAVRGLNLSVPKGLICGFLGRNGAGKSTTIKMLLGITRPSDGGGRVFGLPIDDPAASLEIRRRTGYVGEDKRLYGYMTGEQMICFTRSFYPRWKDRVEGELRAEFDLPLNRKVKTYSKGMRTKLALLLSLARGADLLILDEPTEGLDPVMIEQVLQALVRAAAEGASIFFSSHQIAEVEQIADHVSVIHNGRLLLDGDLGRLKESYRRINLVFPDRAPEKKFTMPGVKWVESDGHSLSVFASHNVDDIVGRARALDAVSVDVVPLTLREIYLESLKEPQYALV